MISRFDEDDLIPLPVPQQPGGAAPKNKSRVNGATTRWLPPTQSLQEVLALCTPCDGHHPYLEYVGTSFPQGYVYQGELISEVRCNGCFVDVVRDATGQPVSLVAKVPSTKRRGTYEDVWLCGASIAGNYSQVGEPTETIVVASSYASSLVLHAATGHCVLAAHFDLNLDAVCSIARAKLFAGEIVIAAGARRPSDFPAIRTVLAQLATKHRALVAVPKGALDFRGLLLCHGGAAVAHAVASAIDVDASWLELDALPSTGPIAWSEPIHPAAMLAALCAHVARHSALRFEPIMAISLWVLLSHVVHRFQVAPILALLSLTRRCGKTTTLAAIEPLVLRPLVTSDITAAGLARACNEKSTMLIDEADQHLKQRGSLMVAVINAGHTRVASLIRRIIAGKQVAFDAFGLKLIAAIGQLPPTIEDRSIVISLLRKHRHDKVERFRPGVNGDVAALRAQIESFVLDYANEIAAAKTVCPDLPSDRAMDNWEPLLAVASVAGSDWLRNAEEAAIALTQPEDAVSTVMEEFIRDLATVYRRRMTNFISSAQIIQDLCADQELAWATYSSGRPLSYHDLGALMRSLKQAPVQKQVEKGKNIKGYMVGDLTDLFARYATD